MAYKDKEKQKARDERFKKNHPNYSKEYYKKNKENIKKYNNKEYYKIYSKKYYLKNKIKILNSVKKWISKNKNKISLYKKKSDAKYKSKPDNMLKIVARKKIYNKLRYGKMKRLPCEVCGNVKSEAHHKDYSKPLDVQWLCKVHHMEEDIKLRAIARH